MSDRLAGFEVPNNLAECLYAGQRFLKREPERSQRALRLVFANWLAHIEIPELRPQTTRRPGHALFREERQQYPALSRQSRGAGRRPIDITPRASKLARLNEGSQEALRQSGMAIHFQTGAAGYRDLVVALAQELYHRERGVLPPSEEALVGTYLQELPDDGSADVDDGTTPTVVDPRVSAGPTPN